MTGDMAAARVPLTFILAATAKNGVGKGGTLPWPMLKKEMAYFARVTKRVPKAFGDTVEAVQNVVIMGRKTWDSIPSKLRPLKNRTNVVITRQDPASLSIADPEVIVASSIESGIDQVQRGAATGSYKTPGRVFVIGGSTIWDSALNLPNKKRILLTRIHQEYDCDTFFSADLNDEAGGFRKLSARDLSEFVEEDEGEGVTIQCIAWRSGQRNGPLSQGRRAPRE